MQVVYPRCAGLDVHKKTVVACILSTSPQGRVTREIRTFSTMTAELLALGDWLGEHQVTHVAIESTGIYWKPVFNVLEEGRTFVLVNPQHIKAVPGRKTDVKDSEWLADLLRHGLLQPSFIPPHPIRAIRELTRYRKTLVHERTQEVTRLHKVLESANIKLSSVVTDILGKSGRAMVEALAQGEASPEQMAQLAQGKLRPKITQLQLSLEGRLIEQHRLLIRHLLAHIDFLEASIAQVQREIDQLLAPLAEAVERLQEIPGISAVAASAILAEIGLDMSRFPSAKHLASWAGLCPGNRQSAGKRLSGTTTKGNPWLRAILGEVVWALSHMHDTYLAAQFHRLARKRGLQKAVVAVAHSVLTIIYYLLRDGQHYQDLGPEYFLKLDQQRVEQHHIRRLQALGYNVTLSPASA
jgi:transposase